MSTYRIAELRLLAALNGVGLEARVLSAEDKSVVLDATIALEDLTAMLKEAERPQMMDVLTDTGRRGKGERKRNRRDRWS